MKKLMVILVFVCSLMFTGTAFALPMPFMSEITRGQDSIRWEWSDISDVDGYMIKLWQGSDESQATYETVYNQTYYIQQNTDQGILYNANVQSFKGSELSGWGIPKAFNFEPDTAPRIECSIPAINATNVPIDSYITTQFSKKIANDSVDVILKNGEQTVAINVYYNPYSNLITFKSVYDLDEGTTYTVYLPPLTDLVGQVSEATYWNFTTYKAPVVEHDGGGSGGSNYTPSTVIAPTTTNIPYSYTDIETNWAKDSIQTLVNKRILPSDVANFYPNNEINREDFIKLLILGMNYQTSAYTGEFSDVAIDNPNAIYIQTALDKGIIQGTSETTFSPNTPITREEIATMFDRTLKLENIKPIEIKPLTEFKDYQQISSWAMQSVQNIYSLDLIKGKTDFANVIIDGQANTSNAENATLLVRLLEKTGK